jgi:hypothetical protein
LSWQAVRAKMSSNFRIRVDETVNFAVFARADSLAAFRALAPPADAHFGEHASTAPAAVFKARSPVLRPFGSPPCSKRIKWNYKFSEDNSKTEGFSSQLVHSWPPCSPTLRRARSHFHDRGQRELTVRSFAPRTVRFDGLFSGVIRSRISR